MNPARSCQPMRLLAAALVALAPLAAAAAAGQFTFVVGEVTLVKASGQRVTAVRGTAVDSGDHIVTGVNGMAQLTMVDQARLSLRPNTQFAIERYPESKESTEGAVLSLLRGTLRAFTGLIAASNRDRFMMKTRVATVGIRGSGNILYACEGKDCDPSVAGDASGDTPITVNHTIEGSHAVTNILADESAERTLITGPGQTVLVAGVEPPRFIPTPSFISEVATNMVNTKPAAGTATTATGDVRSFSPGDTPVLTTAQTNNTPLVGNNGLGFVTIDASANLAVDPAHLQDVILSLGGSPIPGQATQSDITTDGGLLRGYTSYGAPQSALSPAITGGTALDVMTIPLGFGAITLGRWDNASVGFFGPSSATPMPGSVHWITGPSGYPMYLADVLTGTATYTLAGATSPTNQNGTAGSLDSATLSVNFTSRTLGLGLSVSVPGNAGGAWQLTANNVALSLNRFFGSTSDSLVIVNGTGQTSSSTNNLTGSFEGSFVGTGLSGAILGYGISDETAANSANWSFVSGVAGFTGPTQDATAPYREGRVSDPEGFLNDFVRSYATTDRPDEVAGDTQGNVTSFTAPYPNMGSHATYSIGTAQVVQSGADPATGLVWGRWSGGNAQVTDGGQSATVPLANASLHYIFAGPQSGPVTLPLTGTATYDVIGSTSPTDALGHVGTLNSATLDANFTTRSVDSSVNIAINGQTWTGSANDVPIYRDQYFSAYSGTPIPGAVNPAPLTIGCTPACGANAAGSFDGFFTGRSGEQAGLLYNLGGNQGAVAFGRRGGG